MALAIINPKLLQWARKRADMTLDELSGSVHKNYPLWENGEASPTYNQLVMVAKKTYAPIGYFYLSEPPGAESLPIPDHRTAGVKNPGKPSLELLVTIRTCQRRQNWYRDYSVAEGDRPRSFVGSARLSEDPAAVGRRIRKKLALDDAGTARVRNPSLKAMVQKAEDVGLLVMISGYAGSDTKRKLDPEEFQGFALADKHAPVVFVNGAAAKAELTSALAHELAHIWLGASALSHFSPLDTKQHKEEAWCNKVAAELLVPMDALRLSVGNDVPPGNAASLDKLIPALSRKFRVSPLVSVQRLRDGNYITKEMFRSIYAKESKSESARAKPSGRSKKNPDSRGPAAKRKSSKEDAKPESEAAPVAWSIVSRAGNRFTSALVNDTVDRNTQYTEAMRLLGCRSTATIKSLAQALDYPE